MAGWKRAVGRLLCIEHKGRVYSSASIYYVLTATVNRLCNISKVQSVPLFGTFQHHATDQACKIIRRILYLA